MEIGPGRAEHDRVIVANLRVKKGRHCTQIGMLACAEVMERGRGVEADNPDNERDPQRAWPYHGNEGADQYRPSQQRWQYRAVKKDRFHKPNRQTNSG